MDPSFYEIYVADDRGERVGVLENFISFDLALVTNGFGPCTVVLDGIRYDLDTFGQNYRLEFERNGAVLGDAPFLIVGKEIELSGGEYRITLSGLQANSILDKPVIAYYAGSAAAASLVNEPADDLLKRIVLTNLGSLAQTGPHVVTVADGLRDLAAPDISPWFTVAADTSEGGPVNKSFARRLMLAVLQEVAATSAYNGTPVYFGIETADDGRLEFRTRVGQWGTDRRGALVVSPEFNNLVGGRLAYDWRDEITVALALGDGEQESRVVETVVSAQATASLFGWRERTYDAPNTSTVAALQNNGQALLQNNRVKLRLSGEVQETESFQYGVDWSFGDRLDAAFVNWTGEVVVNRLRVTMDKKETLRGTVEV